MPCALLGVIHFIKKKRKEKKERKKASKLKQIWKGYARPYLLTTATSFGSKLTIQQWFRLEYVIFIFFTDIALLKDKRKWYVLQMQHWICICGREIGFRTLFKPSRRGRMCESSSKGKKVCKEIPIHFSVNICHFLAIISNDILYKFLNHHSLLRNKRNLIVKTWNIIVKT